MRDRIPSVVTKQDLILRSMFTGLVFGMVMSFTTLIVVGLEILTFNTIGIGGAILLAIIYIVFMGLAAGSIMRLVSLDIDKQHRLASIEP